MKISDPVFGFLSRYGSILVLLCTLAGVYLVLRNRELDKAVARATDELRARDARRQQIVGVLRDFVGSGVVANDPAVQQIMQKHQLVPAQPQPPPAPPQPGAAPQR